MSGRRGEHGLYSIEAYLADQQASRLPQRLAEASRLPGSRIDQFGVYQGGPPRSNGTSLLHSGSDNLPAYTNAPTNSDTVSLSSSFGGRQLAPRLLEQPRQAGGALEIPPPPTPVFECPFNFRRCLLTFANKEEWFTHSLSHFQDVDPPKTNKCCFCDDEFSAPTGMECWRKRMTHVASHHELRCRLAFARPDFEMFKYLWDNKVIKTVEFKDLMGYSNAWAAQAYPSPPQSPTERTRKETSRPYTVTNTNRRRERRT